MTSEGNTQVNRVEDEGDTQVSNVQTEGNVQSARVTSEGDTQVTRVTNEGNTQVARVISEGDTQTHNAYVEAKKAEAEQMTADSYANEPQGIYVKEYYYDDATDTILYNEITGSYSSLHWSLKASQTAAGLKFQGTWDSVDCSMPPTPTPTGTTDEDVNGYLYIVTNVSGDTSTCPDMSIGDWIVWTGDDPSTPNTVEGQWNLINWTFDWSAITNIPANVINALPTTGGTVTGAITIDKTDFHINSRAGNQSSIYFNDSAGARGGHIRYTETSDILEIIKRNPADDSAIGGMYIYSDGDVRFSKNLDVDGNAYAGSFSTFGSIGLSATGSKGRLIASNGGVFLQGGTDTSDNGEIFLTGMVGNDLLDVNAVKIKADGNMYSVWNEGNFNPDSKVNKSGDTMTGDLIVSKTTPAIRLENTDTPDKNFVLLTYDNMLQLQKRDDSFAFLSNVFKLDFDTEVAEFEKVPVTHTNQGTAVNELTRKDYVDSQINNAVPAGTIVMWSGTTIPSGWKLCDGNDGTPDLRGKFVLGGDTSTVGNTGGSADAVVVSHNHTFTGDALPEHTHVQQNNGYTTNESSTGRQTSANSSGNGSLGQAVESTIGASAGTPTGTISTSGEDGAGKNMPPYYTLVYIMKG